jgi:hypothetical protein
MKLMDSVTAVKFYKKGIETKERIEILHLFFGNGQNLLSEIRFTGYARVSVIQP